MDVSTARLTVSVMKEKAARLCEFASTLGVYVL